ncbi:G5 domain-containing protein [Streptococcus suis]|uniref:G5 domain-containing protein n=1 Tax=Streptococcus suis TaxID=1307 RepID=UPI0021175A6B|nr:G5 domain-containing protein [Streptococcus suis]MCQ8263109.1 G5 domain-containing protein [Streptococcus suis]
MFWDKKQIFSIRKTSLGIGSVLLGLVLLAPTVAADEVPNQHTVRPTTSVETTTDPTSVSIQPKVETSPIPATTEYLADDSLEYGKTEVVTPAVDGMTETVTNYKVVEKPVEMVDQSAKDTMALTDYKYGSTDFYHVDDSQEKPSDKIVIDRLFTDVKTLTEEEIKNHQSIRDIVTGVEYLDFVSYETPPEAEGLLKLTSVDGTKPNIYLTTESIDPTNPTFQALLKEYSFRGTARENGVSTPWTGDLQDTNNSQLRKAVYVELAKKSSEVLANLAGFRYINALVGEGNDEATAVKSYFTSKLPISEQLYADAKANYERFLLAVKEGELKERVFGGGTVDEDGNPYIIMQENPIIRTGQYAFDTITKRYNDAKGSIQNPIVFENTSLSAEDQSALVEKLSQLPDTVKANLLKLIVSDEALDLGTSFRGMAYLDTSHIRLKYTAEREAQVLSSQGKKKVTLSPKQPEDLIDIFLHELGHVIDFRSGKFVYDYYAYQPEDGQVKNSPWMRAIGRLSYSNEFLKVFEEYFLNKEDVWEYIRWTPSEAWADSLGKYINHKIFGFPYTRYKKIDGVVYAYNPSLAGLNAEYDAMKETVYDVGYSPVEASEFYWESIYKKLFEPEVIKETVVDGVTTNITPAQNGKVLVGTKPKVTIESISFKTVEESDASQPVGYRVVKQAGQNGQLETKTTYTVDSKTGQVTETTSTTVLKDTIDEIILVGIKEVTEEISEKPEVTVGSTIEVLAYASREETDSSQPLGYKYTKQVGENGLVKVTITNTKDPKTGQITTEVEREILKAAIDEIVVLGTKVVEEEPKNPSQPINNNEDLQPVVKEELVSKPPVTIPIDEKNSSLVERNTETDNSVKQITGEVITKKHHNPTAVLVNAHLTKTSTLPATGEKESSYISLLGMTSLAGGLVLAASRRRGKYMD